MAIDAQHPGYKTALPEWEIISNICNNENVKQYLLTLNPTDQSAENATRNRDYKNRAVFYAIAGYTLAGLSGLLFGKKPDIELPPELEYLIDNVDGAENSLDQTAHGSADDLISKGRSGLFVTFPQVKEQVSRLAIAEGFGRATIHSIDPGQIINWNTAQIGSQRKLSLVVISESDVVMEDYERVYVPMLRELYLKKGVYHERTWKQDKKNVWQVESDVIPLNGAGKLWTEIPFTFLGSNNNDPKIDKAPMKDLVEINLGHYRNSADFEDAVYFGPGNQPWMSGMTQTHIDLMKNNRMYVGSRNLIGVPSGEQFGYASADPNPLPRTAMQDKLALMIGMGARFIEPSGPAKTATEAAGDQAVQHSVLSIISENLSDGYERAIKWAGQFMGADGDVRFRTATDFVPPTATAQDLTAMVAGWIQGAIPLSDFIVWQQKRGIIDPEKTLEEVLEELPGGVNLPELDDA